MTHSDSEIVDGGPLTLEGVWIHEPDDAQDTSVQYRFGKSSRSTSIDTMGVAHTFAGRAYPVYEYGEHQDDTFSVSMQLAHGPTWHADVATIRAFAESKITLFFRDNRGRAAFGVIEGYSEADQDWGTQIGFTFVRVDHTLQEA